jgi:hypothetical protein
MTKGELGELVKGKWEVGLFYTYSKKEKKKKRNGAAVETTMA